jgi:hypothetical protein
VTVVAFVPSSEPDVLYSRNLRLRLAPAVSARTQTVPVYWPAEVARTQFGESLSKQVAAVAFVFVSFAE